MKLAAAILLASAAAAQTPEALMEGGHFKRARALVEPRWKSSPDDAHANYLMGRVKRGFGNLEAAMKFFEKAVELAPKNAEYHSQLGQTYGEVAQRASVFRQMSLGRKCKKEIDTAVALDPKNIEAQVTLMMFLAKAPGIMGGDKVKSKEIADQLVRDHGARGYMGQSRLAEDRATREALFQKAAATDPKLFSARMNLANLYVNDNPPRLDLAEKHAREAMQINPSRMQPYTVLAAVHVFRDQVEEAAKTLASAETAVPDNLFPHYNTARLLIRQGKHLDRAEAYLRKYLSQEPEASMPPHAYAHWALGQVYEKQGRKAEAVAALKESVKLKPDLEGAKKDLQRLQKS